MQATVRGKCMRFDCMWLTIAVQSGNKNVRIYEIILYSIVNVSKTF